MCCELASVKLLLPPPGPNYLTVQFIHSGKVNQPKNRLISKMAASPFSTEGGDDRTEFDLIFKDFQMCASLNVYPVGLNFSCEPSMENRVGKQLLHMLM